MFDGANPNPIEARCGYLSNRPLRRTLNWIVVAGLALRWVTQEAQCKTSSTHSMRKATHLYWILFQSSIRTSYFFANLYRAREVL